MDKLVDRICDFYEILVLPDIEVSERCSVLVSLKFIHIPISKMTLEDDDDTIRP